MRHGDGDVHLLGGTTLRPEVNSLKNLISLSLSRIKWPSREHPETWKLCQERVFHPISANNFTDVIS